MKERLKLIVAAVLALMGIVLIAQNTEVTEVRVLFWSFEMSRVILMLLMVLVGLVCGFVAGRSFTVERRR